MTATPVSKVAMSVPTKYRRILIVLNWLVAVLVILGLLGGESLVSELKNNDPAKIGARTGHTIIGGTALILKRARLVIRLRAAVPPHVNLASMQAHQSLYALVLAMAGPGVATSLAAGLPGTLFFGTGTLPATFDDLTARAAMASSPKH